MKVALPVTLLACLLALGGCLTVPQTLADSDASVDEDPGTQVWENVAGAAGGGFPTGGVGGEAFGAGGTAGGIAGAAGDAFGVGGVGGDCAQGVAGTGGGCAAGVAGAAGEGFGAGGVGGEGLPTGGTAGGIAGTGGDPFGTGGAGAGAGSQLGTRSDGCELLADGDLCMGEGWMLTEGESIPDCGESGAYRICTFESDACVSHTIMMVQRCD